MARPRRYGVLPHIRFPRQTRVSSEVRDSASCLSRLRERSARHLKRGDAGELPSNGGYRVDLDEVPVVQRGDRHDGARGAVSTEDLREQFVESLPAIHPY